MTEELREQIQQLIGEYSGTVMADNPSWVFDARRAIELADSICALLE